MFDTQFLAWSCEPECEWFSAFISASIDINISQDNLRSIHTKYTYSH